MARLPNTLAALGLTLSVLAVPPAQARPRDDVRFAQVDGRKVAYAVIGREGPAIVFVAGLGEGLDASREVAWRLAAHARVIVYDRAGYGDSAAVPGLKDGAQTTAELDAVLDAAGARGPVVLIGHSIGGQIAEIYAAARPERVAGLVLDDDRAADLAERCRLKLPGPMCKPPSLMATLFPPPMRQEFESAERFAADVKAAAPYAGPVLVISRHPGAGGFEDLWADTQADLARRYGAAHAVAPRGGHYVHKDAAAWFAQQVETFVGKLEV
ncbi:MAG: alpha/beta hydrolase [Caulobacter sp.]|nr:alpha/beta hydrolase [Caulobacter sp.]